MKRQTTGTESELATDSSGGSAPFLDAALSNTAVTVKSTAGKVTDYFIYNPNDSAAFVQFFDTAGAVTVGTTVPVRSIGIPASAAANLAGLNLNFANAIKVAATTTATGNGAPGTALVVNIGYE